MAPRKKGKKRREEGKSQGVLEKRLEDFASELEKLGEKAGRGLEIHGKEWDSWFHNTFGILGPFVSSIFGIIVLSLLSWVLTLINLPLGSIFLSNIQAFLHSYIGVFFMLFLFFSYGSYLSRGFPRLYLPLSPIFVAGGITVAIWITGHVLSLANLSLNMIVLYAISYFLLDSIWSIFIVLLGLAYLGLAVKLFMQRVFHVWVPRPDRALQLRGARAERREKRMERRKEREMFDPHRRLYRSGKDRILGGVCGGIGEYLGVDPVIVRLLWVIAALAWGSGIIAYIIAWVIIPRNPKHRWD
jgi:phage shock protein C